jgi:hypothetical protein
VSQEWLVSTPRERSLPGLSSPSILAGGRAGSRQRTGGGHNAQRWWWGYSANKIASRRGG